MVMIWKSAILNEQVSFYALYGFTSGDSLFTLEQLMKSIYEHIDIFNDMVEISRKNFMQFQRIKHNEVREAVRKLTSTAAVEEKSTANQV